MLVRLVQLARGRSTSTLLAIALLGACSPQGTRESRARELELAMNASERLTAEFGDTVQARHTSREYERQLAKWRDSGWIEACPNGYVDSSGWPLVDLRPFPVLMRIPLGYRYPERRTIVAAHDTLRAELLGAAGEIQLVRTHSPQTLHGLGAAELLSHCEDMVSGAHVHVDTGAERQNPYTKRVYAAYQRPSGDWIVIHATVRGVEAQAQMVAALRTVQLQ